MPRQKNSSRGVADVTNAVRVLNDRTPGAGDQLSQVIRHLSGRIDAQAGHNGTVAIAKQPTTITGGTAAGLNLNSTRLTGMRDPVQGKDLVTLDFFRRHETCDAFRQRVEDCLKLEIKAGPAGPGIELFEPTGAILFADLSLPYVYYMKLVTAHFYDEQRGAIGVIDVSDPHNPVRIAFLVITNYAGPVWFMVDYTRRIGFVRDVIGFRGPGTRDEHLWAAYDFNDPHNPTLISYAGAYPDVPSQWFESPGRPNWFKGQLGNKAEGESTCFGYYMNDTFITGQTPPPPPFISFQTTWFRLHVWNFTDPSNMTHVHSYEMGGYYVDDHGIYPPPSDFGIQGIHLQWSTDRLGRGNFATSVSAGDRWFNFTLRSELFLNNWDISGGSVRLRGRVSLGMGLELSGNYLTSQVRSVLMWGSRAYAIVTTYDPDNYPDDPTGNTLFGIDCSEDTPVIKTRMRHACGQITNIDIFENCLYLHIGSYDTVWDVSDLSDFRLLGGCINFVGGGYANYRPGYLYQISPFGEPNPDPSKPGKGFTVQYFGESGIVCP